MSNIRPYTLHQAGSIAGVAGWFSGGQTIYVDMDTMEVVSQSPILQQPDNPQPLVTPAPVAVSTSAKARKVSK